MPYTYEDTSAGSPFFVEGVTAPKSEVLTEQFAQAFEENPVFSAYRWYSLHEDMRTGKRLSKTEAEARLLDSGLTGQLRVDDAGITENGLWTLMARKRRELRRQETFARAKGGFGEGTERFATALLTSLSDPINVGASFVPVVGQAKYLRWLASARGMLGRTVIRAGVGALEGAVGAAAVEPLIYGSRTAEQADYDAVDSLMNASFGAVLGTTLHSGAGAIRDFGRGIRLRALKRERAARDFSTPSAPPAEPPKYRVIDESQVTPEQLQRIKELYAKSQEEGATGDQAAAIDYLSRVPEDEGFQKFYAVNSKGEIVAGISVAKNVDGSAYGHHLGSVEVGAGKFLVKHLLSEAEKMGISRVELSPRPGSEKFHERMGFKEQETVAEGGEPQWSRDIPKTTEHVNRTRAAVDQLVNDEPVNVVDPVNRTQTAEPTVDEHYANQLWEAYNSRTEAMGFDKEVIAAARATGITFNKAGFDKFLAEYTARDRVTDATIGPDPEIEASIKAADEIKETVPEDPAEAIDEDLANAESELASTEKKLDHEESEAEKLEMAEIEEAVKKSNDWARAAEVATDCILKGTL